MSKGPALYDYIEIDGHDVGNSFSEIGYDFVDEEEDVSGFSATGLDETVAGKRVQTVTGTIFMDFDAGKSWDILYDIYKNRSVVTFKTRPNQNLPVSATNPSLEGNVTIREWHGGGTRGAVRSFPITLKSDVTGLEFVTT